MKLASRRAFLRSACAIPLIAAAARHRALASAGGSAESELKPITGAAKAISPSERRARIAKVQELMVQGKVDALLIETGSSLEYFTGIRWRLSERTTAAIIPARGDLIIVTPAFEEPSVRETLEVNGDVRAWNEHESPFVRIVQALRDRGVTSGVVAVEATIRFFIVDGVRQASNGYQIISADPLIRACRMIKSPAELALMQIANDVTIAALRHVHGRIERGMSSADLGALMNSVTIALGGSPEFSLVLLNEASAYPHGSLQPQTIREGSIVLMDCGCTVQGYEPNLAHLGVRRSNAPAA